MYLFNIKGPDNLLSRSVYCLPMMLVTFYGDNKQKTFLACLVCLIKTKGINEVHVPELVYYRPGFVI